MKKYVESAPSLVNGDMEFKAKIINRRFTMSIDAIGVFDGIFDWDDEKEAEVGKSSIPNFQEVVCGRDDKEYTLTKPVSLHFPWTNTQHKIVSLLEAMFVLNAEGSVMVGGSMSWGGKDGVEYSGYVKGEVSGGGNRAEVKVEQNSDGSGRVEASGGYDSASAKASDNKKE